MDKIYQLNLGESIEIDTKVNNSIGNYTITYIVTRVPGGWIFKRTYRDSSPVFIPFYNEK